MRALVFAFLFGGILAPSLHAIPNAFFGNGNAIPIIPAFPRFNADLTEEFLDEKAWKAGEFSGPWADEPSLPDLTVRRMTANPVVLGEVPMSVVAYGDGSETTEIAVHFLDAGLYFGYRAGGESDREQREEGRARRTEFARHFKKLSETIEERLEEGCGRGEDAMLGRHPMLRTPYTEYRWEDFVLRLVRREDHSVSLHIYRSGTEPRSIVTKSWSGSDRRDRQALLKEHVSESASGVLRVEGLPMFTQGMTPFCGIHSLAIVGHHIGLRTSAEALAAAADFKNTGSAGGSDLVGLHQAVADELDMRVGISPKWNLDRVESSIEQGLPVIVWRRVSMEREKLHAEVARRIHRGEAVELSPLTDEEREDLPEKGAKGSPSHASVITGIDEEAGIVYYMEPWGEVGRHRQMRVEELEATAYAVFHFRL